MRIFFVLGRIATFLLYSKCTSSIFIKDKNIITWIIDLSQFFSFESDDIRLLFGATACLSVVTDAPGLPYLTPALPCPAPCRPPALVWTQINIYLWIFITISAILVTSRDKPGPSRPLASYGAIHLLFACTQILNNWKLNPCPSPDPNRKAYYIKFRPQFFCIVQHKWKASYLSYFDNKEGIQFIWKVQQAIDQINGVPLSIKTF